MKTFVYIIESPNVVKIGISNNPESRLASLQTANPNHLGLAHVLECKTREDARMLESLLHSRYAEYRQTGEWFSIPAKRVINDIQWSISVACLVTGGSIHIEKVETIVTQETVQGYGILKPIIRLMKTFDKPQNIYTKETIIEKGKEYTRGTHPLLFAVVDYLENNEDIRNSGVRKIAETFTKDTGQKVGKSWAAVAKNYWKSYTK